LTGCSLTSSTVLYKIPTFNFSVCVLAVCNISGSTPVVQPALPPAISRPSSPLSSGSAYGNILLVIFFSPSTHLDCCSGLRRPPLTLPWPYIFFLTFRYPYTTSVRRTRFSSSLGDLGVLDWTLSNLGRAGNIDSTQPAEETGTDYIAHRCIHTSNATLAHLLIITLTSIFTKHIVPYPSYTRHP
jgi:hypothetical protein